jgi:hypothetical protein
MEALKPGRIRDPSAMVQKTPTDEDFEVLAAYIADNVKKQTNDVLRRA